MRNAGLEEAQAGIKIADKRCPDYIIQKLTVGNVSLVLIEF